MTDDEKWAHIDIELSKLKSIMEEHDKVMDVLQVIPESPICDPVYRLYDSLIATLSALVDDDFDSIGWFVYECEFGARGFEYNGVSVCGVSDLRSAMERSGSDEIR